jgi:RyR domain
MSKAYNPPQPIERIAQFAHEINRAYCGAIGDNSQPIWADAPDWQKDSAIKNVKMHLENPAATAKDSHDSWMAEKVEAGWVLGDVKDAKAKTHPAMLPYDELPIDIQVKDHLFRKVVELMALVSC